ncbi:multicopper oxidase domain-containing protein [Skermanella pratensis]|uniref:multicopper oxidase domain-containing protein n=1 Tax=Skermanella pratensis TaxID=2233999 RepID=UPI00130114E4|nr:multicopper oxidase domain-containing protein [Skermanella pratensis]
MRRRQFLQYGGGLAGVAGLSFLSGPLLAQAAPPPIEVSLRIQEADVEMVDGSAVFMWAFSLGTGKPSVPGPVIRLKQGQTVTLTVQNLASTPHSLQIPGMPGVSLGPIAPNGIGSVTFTVGLPGTYFYLDPDRAPLNRLLGLHGAIVVEPAAQPPGSPATPYAAGQATPGVRALFSALGNHARFPGSPWQPGRDRIWVFNQIDPRINKLAEAGDLAGALDLTASFLPRYFTINGLSGVDAAHDEATVPRGRVGQPLLLRALNAGLATHSPHIHGNHVFTTAEIVESSHAVRVLDNIIEEDTWSMPPLMRRDLLLPFAKPPEIPDAAWPPRQEKFPLIYPMHCHNEISQTSAGGSYPLGLVTDWIIEGPL